MWWRGVGGAGKSGNEQRSDCGPRAAVGCESIDTNVFPESMALDRDGVLGPGFWVPGIENRWFSASSRFRLLASTWALGHFSTASGTGRNRIIPGVTGATFTASGYGGACFGNVRESDAVFMEVGVIKWEVYQVSANEHVSSCQGLSIETCIDTRVTALHLTGGGKVEQGYIACFRLRMVISTIS